MKKKKRFYQSASLFLVMLLVILPFCRNIPAKSVQALSDGQENLVCSMSSIEGESVTTTATAGQPTVIVFGKTDCSNTQRTIKGLADSGKIVTENARVIYGELNNASTDAIKTFKQAYGCDDIIFCGIPDGGNKNPYDVWNEYCNLDVSTSGALPTTVVIDGNNKVKKILWGYQTADTIFAAIGGGTEEKPGTKPEPDTAESVSVQLEGTESYAYANEILTLANEARAEKGLAALKLDESLLEAAMQRAAELSLYYSHTRPDGTACFTISERGTKKAENIAVSYKTPQDVMAGWISSEGHYANIMDADVTSIGIGCFMDSRGTWNWVQFFDNAPAVEPVVSESRTVRRSVLIKKEFLHLQADVKRTFTDSDINITVPMHIYQGNEEWNGSRPELLPSNFDFDSSNASVAEVNGEGNITVKGTGTAVITAALKSDSSVFVKQTVTVESTAWTPGATPPVFFTPTPTAVPTPTPTVPVSTLAPSPSVSPTPVPSPSTPSTPVPVTPAPVQPTETAPAASSSKPSETEPSNAKRKPSAVTFKVTAGKKKASLKWSKVKGADGYIIYFKSKKNGTWKKVITTKKTSYTKKKLKSGKKYFFTVKAYKKYNGKMYTGKSSVIKVKVK